VKIRTETPNIIYRVCIINSKIQRFEDSILTQNLTHMHYKLRFNKLFEFLITFGLITAHKFMQIHMNTSNIVYYIFL
jgi:hypothetical protein